MVEYHDGSILSQMGPSDMRTPIAYCLGWPERIQTSGDYLDFEGIQALTFEKPDTEKFQSLTIVRQVLAEGQGSCIIFNAANEIANEAFLSQKIGFLDIIYAIESALDTVERFAVNSLEDVIALDNDTRHSTTSIIQSMIKDEHDRNTL
jgi:1-deoxy-D-xylulose-5-phosphate reductoisomerase